MSVIGRLQDLLVSDWRSAHKFWTLKVGGVNAIIQCVFIGLLKGATIAVGTLGFVPLVWVPIIGLAGALATMVVRILSQNKPETDDPLEHDC